MGNTGIPYGRMSKQEKTGATLNRHGSNPNRGTPPNFVHAVVDRFGTIVIDLAATKENSVVGYYYGPDNYNKSCRDTFSKNWAELDGNLWLNPPFDQLDKFAEKFGRECQYRRAFAFFLAPASVGANWFQLHIAPHCYVLELQDRITFIGEKSGFPKDLILAVAGFGIVGRSPWHWDDSKTKTFERKRKQPSIPRSLIKQYAAIGFEPNGDGAWMPIEGFTAAQAAEIGRNAKSNERRSQSGRGSTR